MRYLSVCSGIEAATSAWHPMGWRPAAFAEIEPFPSAVLAHHYPAVPNFGDMTKFQEWPDATIDILVGGTPCQSFSVAGLRKGLADPRGNLMLTYLAIADRYRPQWLVWENVPGVLSSNGGRDFGTFLGGLGQLGYGFAYRVLDAQFVRVESHARAVPQRRRRVFVVGCLGDWRRAAAVLLERDSLSGHSAPRREAGKGIAARALCSSDGGIDREDRHTLIAFGAAPCLDASFGRLQGCAGQDANHGHGHLIQVAHSLRGEGFDASDQNGGGHQAVMAGMQVRRLTPRECERLQGFPDDFTNIPWRGKPEAPDGLRYKALGNSMAVNCMRFLGERSALVEQLTK